MRVPSGALSASLFVVLKAFVAQAAMPTAEALLAEVGYSPEETRRVQQGEIVRHETEGANDRDLSVGLAFFVKAPPAVVSKSLRAGGVQALDPNTLATGRITSAAIMPSFAKLELKPDPESRAKQYATIQPGDDLNLSSSEIAEFNKLGETAAPSAIEAQLRNALLARYKTYRAKGLAAIESYDRGEGKTRSPGTELIQAMQGVPVQKHAPKVWEAMVRYPSARMPRTEENFRWEQFKARGVPTVALSHTLSTPDGEGVWFLQRKFYVSEGFNCEQAVAALVPTLAGTVVVYTNHTSTDQVEGAAGGGKRAIGRGMLASQLEGLFQKLQKRFK